VPNKDVKGTFFEQDNAGVGARLLLGSATRAAVIETDLARTSPQGSDSKTAFKLAGGAQLRLATDIWISVSVGATRGGSPAEQRGAFVLSSFKWALSREPAITVP
jgi:hypothetical protein